MLLAPELTPPPLGWGLHTGGAVLSLLERIAEVSAEPTRFTGRLEVELSEYVTALHALVLDLVDLTGAPTNGRRRPAHTALLEQLGIWQDGR